MLGNLSKRHQRVTIHLDAAAAMKPNTHIPVTDCEAGCLSHPRGFMMLKAHSLIITATLLLSLHGFSQSPALLLERGVQLLETENSPQDARAALVEAVEKSKDSAAVLAEALYHLARCEKALGNDEAFKDAIAQLNETFGEGSEWSLKAGRLTQNPATFLEAPFIIGEQNLYEVRAGERVIGHFQSLVTDGQIDGEPVWISHFGRHGVNNSSSQAVFKKSNFSPLRTNAYFENFALSSFDFGEDGSFKRTDDATGKSTVTASSGGPIFENDQSISLMRAIDFSSRQPVTLNLVNFLGIQFPFVLTPEAEVEIETPVGNYTCLEISTNINQTLYISTGPERDLVKMIFGGAEVILSEKRQLTEARDRSFEIRDPLPAKLVTPFSVIPYAAEQKENAWELPFQGAFANTQNGVIRIAKGDGSLENYTKKRLRAMRTNKELTPGDLWRDFEAEEFEGVSLISTLGKGHLQRSLLSVFVKKGNAIISIGLSYTGEKDEAELMVREILEGLTIVD